MLNIFNEGYELIEQLHKDIEYYIFNTYTEEELMNTPGIENRLYKVLSIALEEDINRIKEFWLEDELQEHIDNLIKMIKARYKK